MDDKEIFDGVLWICKIIFRSHRTSLYSMIISSWLQSTNFWASSWVIAELQCKLSALITFISTIRLVGVAAHRVKAMVVSICGNQMNFSGPSVPGFTDGLRAVFVMHKHHQDVFDTNAIHRNSFNFDANDLLLQLLKNFLKHTTFRSSIHPECIQFSSYRKLGSRLSV